MTGSSFRTKASLRAAAPSFNLFIYLERDAAKDLAFLEPLVSLGRFIQRITRSEGNLQSSFLDGFSQPGEFPRTCLCVVGCRF